MYLKVSKERFFTAIQKIIPIVDKRSTFPILSNILISLSGNVLKLIATDMEIEIQTTLSEIESNEGSFTISGRKLHDIVRLIDDDEFINIEYDGSSVQLCSGRSKYHLISLPASEFPTISSSTSLMSIEVDQNILKPILDRTSFAMANQDVRYYLNGLLLEFREKIVRSVATDGHRLAISDFLCKSSSIDEICQVIIPRKAVIELSRLLTTLEIQIGIDITSNTISFYHPDFILTSKLIDGRYPDYERVIPKQLTKSLTLNRLKLRQSLLRVSVLSNEKYRGVRLTFQNNKLILQAHNPEHEIADEEYDIEYENEPLSISFNISYLLDVMNNITSDYIQLNFNDENSSALIHSTESSSSRYVIMPMRL